MYWRSTVEFTHWVYRIGAGEFLSLRFWFLRGYLQEILYSSGKCTLRRYYRLTGDSEVVLQGAICSQRYRLESFSSTLPTVSHTELHKGKIAKVSTKASQRCPLSILAVNHIDWTVRYRWIIRQSMSFKNFFSSLFNVLRSTSYSPKWLTTSNSIWSRHPGLMRSWQV